MEGTQGVQPVSQVPLTAVVACSPTGVIGLNGGLPWKLSSDLQRFKTLTMGGTLIMGRKTFDSIGRVLPGRQTIVLTRAADWSPGELPGAERLHVATTAAQAIDTANRLNLPAYVVGGAEIYHLLFPYCQTLWITRVEADVDGDTRVELPLERFVLEESTSYRHRSEIVQRPFSEIWRRQIGIEKNSVPKNGLSPLS